MLRDPMVGYELRTGGETDPSFLQAAEASKAKLTAEEAHAVFDRFEQAANAGNPFSMCMCSRLSHIGWGTARSDAECYRWARQAAALGYGPGLYELGMCFELGRGVSKDMSEAAKLYECASQARFGFAAHRLGRGYMTGDFGVIDPAKAVEYMRRAYELGESLGAFHLGEWFESGRGVSQNLTASVAWYTKASELGDGFASLRLCEAYMRGELGLPRNEQLARHYEELSGRQA